MGNQLVGIAPSQIFPVERYLTDLPEIRFDLSLGSTRFLKVARAESAEGLIVIKVFVIHDPTLPLLTYKEHLEDIRKKLSSAVNCIPYQKIVLTERAGFVIREYVKYSLYDRISTRPFLTNIEKKWITFQILYALHQCHKVGVCHGDIKLENITITSWNWVLLVDFASFKPTFVPVDSPADYNYFFDTSRRRSCYLAPERFAPSSKTNMSTDGALIAESTCDTSDLTPAMDIFSAGCVLLELWNELHVSFEYSQLLEYRKGTYSPQKHLDKLEDPHLKALITSMIQRDPSKRLSAEDYLDRERGRLFPEYFFSFLQSYMLIFSSNPILIPDEKIIRLKKDIGNIFKFLGPLQISDIEEYDEQEKSDLKKDERGECESLVLITSLVTSCIRGLHDCSSKLSSLEILLVLAHHASDETILDRILPYILELARDPTSRVKISSIETMTKCLGLVRKLPRSDANIFPEYILPGVAHLATDPATLVRVAYARNIGTLAEIALRYLEQLQSEWYNNKHTKQKDGHYFNYELELQALHEMVQKTVSGLLTDSNTVVKQTLMVSDISKLCVFFGKQKANDVLLSHMITFLNDKEDKELRGVFFDCIVEVATYIGWHCSSIMTPLLLQGLTDCSEFVTVKSINAMSSLTQQGLIRKHALCELISECSCFLVHPNLWVRQALAGFVATACSSLSILDIQCKVMVHVSQYMSNKIMQIDRPELLLDSLFPPIPRFVYDSVISYSDVDSFFALLNERRYWRKGKLPSADFTKDLTAALKKLIRVLEASGMNVQTEGFLLNMETLLKKIHGYKVSADARHNRQNEGRIEVSSEKSHVFILSTPQRNDFLPNRLLRTNTTGSIDTSNSEWNYSSEGLTRQSESTNSGGPSSRSTSSRPSSPPPDPHISTDPSSNVSSHEKSYIHYKDSSCYVDLTKLRQRQQELYLEGLRNKEYAEQAAWLPQLPPPGWHLRGVLAAHLHEHKKHINKLCTLPNTSFFSSSSADGTIRLWDASKIESRSIANRSKQLYKFGSDVTGMAMFDGGKSFGSSCLDGTINVLSVDNAGSKMNLVQSKTVDKDEDGYAVDMSCLDFGAQTILVYATLYGDMVGWDIRSPDIAWRFKNGLRKGLITTFCIDKQQNWLTLGTSSGIHITWDLRFQLPITSFEHLPETRIEKIVCHPTEPSWVISSSYGNNEVSMWNLETSFRQKVLWGSSSPPFSRPTQGSTHSIKAMLAGCIDRSPFLISGGTDQRLRFWDLENPSNSKLIIPAAADPVGTAMTYQSRLIDGTEVISEECVKMRDRGDEAPRPGPEPPSAGHRDMISDAVLCKAKQCFLVTSSWDGVIKVWK